MTYNKFAGIFKKLKDIFERDERTSQYQILGGQYSKKKTLPCVLVFPESKVWIDEPNTRNLRGAGLPKQVIYRMNLWSYVSLTDIEDSYYNEFEGAKAGLTQVLTDLEAVLIDNKTGTDVNDTSIQLWTNMAFEVIEISQKPGKLMHGKLSVDFYSKELS